VRRSALDAFISEVRAADDDDLSTTRLALTISPKRLDELQHRISAVLDEFALRDDPDGEHWAVFFASHRRK
jgi:hypothetical protein